MEALLVMSHRRGLLFPLVLLLSVVLVVLNGRPTLGFHVGCLGNQRPPRTTTTTTTTATTTTSLRSVSLKEYLDHQISSGTIDSDLCDVLMGVAKSCAEVSGKLKTHTLDQNNMAMDIATTVNVQGEQQKGMDVVANDIFLQNLGAIRAVGAMASEEEESVVYGNGCATNDVDADVDANAGANANADANDAPSNGRRYEIAFDPLDGSGNLDVNLPTGSIFGIADFDDDDDDTATPFSRPGSALVASGYALYSASTEFVVSFGTDHPCGVVGFTLVDGDSNDDDDNPNNHFVLSRPNIRCPSRGPYYSLNEAREPDWPDGLRKWMFDAKRGATTTCQTYSSRYVCSLCADVHRTLLEGGWAGNPRPHLRLLYEAAPLAHLMEAAGGKGSDGIRNLLDIPPSGLHDRVCVFLGSHDDICDLESYGDVQQTQAKRYDA